LRENRLLFKPERSPSRRHRLTWTFKKEDGASIEDQSPDEHS
jgi:hypothetical protein